MPDWSGQREQARMEDMTFAHVDYAMARLRLEAKLNVPPPPLGAERSPTARPRWRQDGFEYVDAGNPLRIQGRLDSVA